MPRRTSALLALLVLLLVLPSCAKLERPMPSSANLPSEDLPGRASLPAQWGNLVSVTSADAFPDLLQLWFQDREGNVRMVVFNLSTNEFLHAKRIGRL